MTKYRTPSTPPPTLPIRSVQYDLFSRFVANNKSEVSNTVEIWESIPKYFLTPAQVDKLRTPTGHADPYKWDYTYAGKPCAVKIQPALIEQEDGSYKAFFPGVTEELVEEALKKILVDQQYGLHDPKREETWVRFTLSMIQRELKAMGRDRNRNQIKQAIEVMSSCILSVTEDGQEAWRGPILSELVTVGRKEYLADTDAHHIAKLPLFISYGINRLEYRQFNYERLMSCNEQLSRWIYKRLINRFRQASLINSYHFMYSDLVESGLLQQATTRDNRKKVVAALDELQEQRVVMRYETQERKEGRKVANVKYTVFPTSEFVAEQKAANKRSSDNAVQARTGLALVDK